MPVSASVFLLLKIPPQSGPVARAVFVSSYRRRPVSSFAGRKTCVIMPMIPPPKSITHKTQMCFVGLDWREISGVCIVIPAQAGIQFCGTQNLRNYAK